MALREGTLPARFFSSVAKPRRKPRSFSVKVHGTDIDLATDEASVNGPGSYWFGDRESEIPQAGEGERVYLHSAVLTGGYAMLNRLVHDEKEYLDESTEDFATQACYTSIVGARHSTATSSYSTRQQTAWRRTQNRSRADLHACQARAG